jgi:hypothetical protein
MEQFKLIIIDESSMVNSDLYNTILDTAGRFRTKVIFMGDPFQLTPVKSGTRTEEPEEMLSPVFTDTNIRHVPLTKVERQQDSNPLMFIYDAIRSDITSPFDLFEHRSRVQDDEGILFYKKPPEFAEYLIHTFRENSLVSDPGIAKMLCWQNETVQSWNNYLRMNLFGSQREPLHAGEVLMAYKNVYDEDPSKGMLVQNSAEYLVKNVKTGVNGGIAGWYIQIEDIDSLNPLLTDVFVVRPDASNYLKFFTKEQEYLNKAKAATQEKRSWYWKQYYVFKNQYLLLENIVDNYNHILVGKDFDYAYALTVHKSCLPGSYKTYLIAGIS